MGRQKIIVDGEHATRRVHFAITPKMERLLNAIALIHETDRADIVRDLLAEFLEAYVDAHSANKILEEILSEASERTTDKYGKNK